MRPLRLLLSLSTCLLAILLLSYIATSRTHRAQRQHADEKSGFATYWDWHSPSSLFPPSAIISLTDDNSTFFLARPANFGPPLSSKGLSGQLWIGSGFGDDGGIGRGVAGAEGELGCSDVPGWNDGEFGGTTRAGSLEVKTKKKKKTGKNDRARARVGNADMAKDKRREASAEEASGEKDLSAQNDGTDDHLHHPLPASGGLANSETAVGTRKPTHADIQSLQESAEIAGKVVLLSRGGCGFLEKVKWVQRRGGIALIVGDDIRGGPLVTMYARGDTSNVTIPSLFTSHTTAHLLSSLIPSGGYIEDISLDDAQRLGLVAGESTVKGSVRGKTGSKDRASGRSNNPSKSASGRKADAVSKESKKGSEKATTESGRSWLRSVFSKSSRRNGYRDDDLSRFPSSGNIGWILQEDFNEDDLPPAKAKTVKQSTTSTKKTAPTKVGEKSNRDGFVIGVHDWRDPDLVDLTEQETAEDAAASTKNKQTSSKGANKDAPGGGSITPGSGEYVRSSGQAGWLSRFFGDKDEFKKKPILALEHHESSLQKTTPQRMLPGEQTLQKATPHESSKKDAKDLKDPKAPQTLHQTDQPSSEDEVQPPTGEEHEGLWVTLTPTSMSSSPFFDTLLVLVVSPLVTLTVVYALLLLRSRIRRRRWRAPKSVVERLPVRTYHTIASTTGTSTSSNSGSNSPLASPTLPTQTTPLLQNGARCISQTQVRPRSRTAGDAPAGSSFRSATPGSVDQAQSLQETREARLAEWRRRYGGKQKECVVCLEEYVDGVSRVMSLPCGHEFHAECM